MHQNHLEGLFKTNCCIPPKVSESVGLGESRELVFIAYSQVILMLLVTLRITALADGKTELDGIGFS